MIAWQKSICMLPLSVNIALVLHELTVMHAGHTHLYPFAFTCGLYDPLERFLVIVGLAQHMCHRTCFFHRGTAD